MANRTLYVLRRFCNMIISSVSRLINALFYGGSTHQTLSSRAYIEGKTDPKWAKRRDFIDFLFWFQKDHCKLSWASDVAEAELTLMRTKVKF
jgi:hypothetical protein